VFKFVDEFCLWNSGHVIYNINKFYIHIWFKKWD
jgi:hypothetical protein